MNDIFKLRNTDRLTGEKYKLNLGISKPNQVNFGTRILKKLRSENMECLTLPYKNFR